MESLVEHLERYLGPIETGWTKSADHADMPFQIVQCRDGSGPGTISFVTLGLSRFGLRALNSEQEIRHELLMVVPESFRQGPAPGILQQVGNGALSAGRPLLRGDVIGPAGPLVPKSRMTALYVGIPVYFDDSFAVCEEAAYAVAIVWLIPISDGESNYVAQHGWDAFEDLLAEEDPDLTDLYRDPIVEH